MKFIKEKTLLKNLNIKPCNIIISHTEETNCDSNRSLLLKSFNQYNLDDIIDNEHDFLLLEGYHCSCYDYDNTEWNGTLYTLKELKKLAQAEYNDDDIFWQLVRDYFNII